MNNMWLHRYAVLLVVCTLFLVIAGASVTSNEAGLSVPDWPLSYGRLMPEMTGGVFYEHGHRMIATTVGFMTIILAVWLWRVEPRAWLRRLGWIALAAVIFQGILGGITVLYLLPKVISIAHACLAELFFSLTAAIALFTSPSWKRGAEVVDDSGWPSLRSMAIVTPVAVLSQVALGAAYRHGLMDIIPHIVGASVVTGLVLYLSVSLLMQYGFHRGLRRAGLALTIVTFVQVFLGIAAYISRISTMDSVYPMAVMVFFTVLHVGAGALTMASSVLVSIQIMRNVRPSAVEVPQTA
ncbi:MAG: COX15/CtaA family protein [Bryobacterales bacterium]|nr:COX15/CtaA family protein [Bryobacterales bacterium]